MTTVTYAILPFGDEYCVAHVGIAKNIGNDEFKSSWVVDALCPTLDLAVQEQLNLVSQQKARQALVKADLSARGIRHG